WRMMASTGDDVASPRLAIFKNVAWRHQERRRAIARKAGCSVAV
ncbi:hypothetical protein A2U01_0093231, partial [Trifolium medium]|nr:hypothetical protein [Trifolium medium]